MQAGAMTHYSATFLEITADLEHGEGWIVFQWPHERYGHEELTIDLDGFCQHRMPIHSGQGPPEFVELTRHLIRLRFEPRLASQLKLDEEIEISFQLSETEFAELHRVIDFFSGEELGESS